VATRKKKLSGVSLGDVYAVRVGPNLDRFGALRVLELMKDGAGRGKDSALLVCTEYLGAQPPQLDEPALRRPLTRKIDGNPGHAYGFIPGFEIGWANESPPPELTQFIGNFPPTPQEQAIERDHPSYGKEWWLASAVYTQWRWEHERDAVLRDRKAALATPVRIAPATESRRRTRGSQIDEAAFWRLVSLIDLDAGDGSAAIERLVEALAVLPNADLREFDELLAETLFRLDRKELAESAGDSGNSSDGFLYARCFVIAQGRVAVEATLADPKSFPKDRWLEVLLGAVSSAHVRRTGDEPAWETFFSCETGANAKAWS